MQVNNYTHNIIWQNTNRSRSIRRSPANSVDTVSFKGHSGIEYLGKNDIYYLIHETAFFREQQTDEFIKKHIYENMMNKDKIKIISAGCSTGEEAITYSMILNDIKDKIKILGFDLSEKAIKQAKSGKFIFQYPIENPKIAGEKMQLSSYKDSYLVCNQLKELTPQEKKNKELFDDFFEPVENNKPNIPKLLTKLHGWLFKNSVRFEKKYYKLKEGKAANCKFIQYDIRDIDKITGDEKADIILFRNAMYHIIEDRYCEVYDEATVNYNKSVVKNTVQKMRNGLNDGGLIVFGQDEDKQMTDISIVQNALKELGLKPLNETTEHLPNVWQKG